MKKAVLIGLMTFVSHLALAINSSPSILILKEGDSLQVREFTRLTGDELDRRYLDRGMSQEITYAKAQYLAEEGSSEIKCAVSPEESLHQGELVTNVFVNELGQRDLDLFPKQTFQIEKLHRHHEYFYIRLLQINPNFKTFRIFVQCRGVSDETSLETLKKSLNGIFK